MSVVRDYADTVIDEWKRIHPEEDLGTFGLALRLIRAGRILETQLDEIVSAHGLAASGDYELLSALRRSYPHPLQPAQLALRHLITTSGMTGRLDRLERAGFVKRSPHPRDRRATEIHITESGIKTADTIFAARVRTESARLASISDTVKVELTRLLRIVLSDLDIEVTGDGVSAAEPISPSNR